jgi:mRNA interferase MazF
LSKGDIWLVDITETVGHEQYGTRPAVILAEITHYLIAILIPLRKNLKTATAPFTTVIQPTKSNGLSVPSVALGIQIRAVDRKRLLRKLGALDSTDLANIDAQLRQMLQL